MSKHPESYCCFIESSLCGFSSAKGMHNLLIILTNGPSLVPPQPDLSFRSLQNIPCASAPSLLLKYC